MGPLLNLGTIPSLRPGPRPICPQPQSPPQRPMVHNKAWAPESSLRLPSPLFPPHELSLSSRSSAPSPEACLLRSPRITQSTCCHLYPRYAPTMPSLAAPTAPQSLCLRYTRRAAWTLLGSAGHTVQAGAPGPGRPANQQPARSQGRQADMAAVVQPLYLPRVLGAGTVQKARPASHEEEKDTQMNTLSLSHWAFCPSLGRLMQPHPQEARPCG